MLECFASFKHTFNLQMTFCNFKFNPDKSEFVVFGSEAQCQQLSSRTLSKT